MVIVLNTFNHCPVVQTRSVAELHAQNRAMQHEPLLEQLYLADSPDKLWECMVKLTFTYRDAFSRHLFGGPLVFPLAWACSAGSPELDMCLAPDCKGVATVNECAKCVSTRTCMRLFDLMCGSNHTRRAEALSMVRALLIHKYPIGQNYPEFRSVRASSSVTHKQKEPAWNETKLYNLSTFRLKVATTDPLPPDERAACVMFVQHNKYMHMSYTSDSMYGVWRAMCHFVWRHLISITGAYHGNATTKHLFRRQPSDMFPFSCARCRAGPAPIAPCYYCTMCGMFAAIAEVLIPPSELQLLKPHIAEECTLLFQLAPSSSSSPSAVAAVTVPRPVPTHQTQVTAFFQQSKQPPPSKMEDVVTASSSSSSAVPSRPPKGAAAYFAAAGPIRAVATPLPSSVEIKPRAAAASPHQGTAAASERSEPAIVAIPAHLPEALQQVIFIDGFLGLHDLMPKLGPADRRIAEAVLKRDTDALLRAPACSKCVIDNGLVNVFTSALSDSVADDDTIVDHLTSFATVVPEGESKEGAVSIQFACLCVALSAFGDKAGSRFKQLMKAGYVQPGQERYCEQLYRLCVAHPGVRRLDIYRVYTWLAPRELLPGEPGPLPHLLRLLDEFSRNHKIEYATHWNP